MQLYDAGLYDRWVDITQGRVENPAKAISADFGAGYVLTDLDHAGFLDRASEDPQMVEVYRDEHAVVYRLTGP
jgi:hypothetical protein